jgi:polyhydroxyalkanoate synthesis regulator phasin
MQMSEALKTMLDTLDRLTPARAQQIAQQVMSGEGREQVTKFAQDLVERSQKSRDRLTALVQGEVKRQLKQLGVASRDEVDSLKKRVRELERGSGGAAKKSPAKRSTKRPASKASSAKKSTEKR